LALLINAACKCFVVQIYTVVFTESAIAPELDPVSQIQPETKTDASGLSLFQLSLRSSVYGLINKEVISCGRKCRINRKKL